eukprot:m.46055 g.46055  ORF g.46055 m.46055 type:complete len:515 (+) comp12221_c0_seq1:132-1676(+)
MSKGPGVGISIGSTTAVVAVCNESRADVVANAAGHRATPCVVSVLEEEVLVGVPAKHSIVRNHAASILRPTAFLGLSPEDELVASLRSMLKFAPLADTDNDSVAFQVGEQTMSCEEAISHVLLEAKTTAEMQTHDKVKDIVMTIPVDASEKWIAAMNKACEKAGLRVVRFITEPVAAMMAYDVDQGDEKTGSSLALVVDVGGTKTSAAVVQSNAGIYQVLGYQITQEVCGETYDKITTSILTTEFQRKAKVDVSESRRALLKLKLASETVKKTLSVTETAITSIESLYEGIDLNCTVPKARFEGMAGPVTRRISDLIDDTLKSCSLSTNDISVVLLHGGCSQMSVIKRAVEGKFGNERVRASIPGDEVAALGASKQAFVLNQSESQTDNQAKKETTSSHTASTAVQGLARSIALRLPNNQHQVLLNKATPIPIRATFPLNCSPGATSMSLVLTEVQGDGSLKDIAKLALKDIATTKTPQCKLVLTVGKEGCLTATMTDSGDKHNRSTVTINSKQ